MEFELIFEHEDEEDDRLSIRKVRDYTIFRSEGGSGEEVEVRLRHDRVAALHAALGEWLYAGELNSPPIAENSLIDQLIVRRVRDEVARVLPLHLAPIAEFVGRESAWRSVEPEPAPKYEDAGSVTTVMANRLLSELTRMSDVAKRAAGAIQESSRVWGTDGTSPNGPVPLCQARGCGHEYAQHTDGSSATGRGCGECPCVRYRSNG